MHWLRPTCYLALLAVALAVQTLSALAERRMALVIGNSSYQHTSPLPNPRNDAKDIASALRRLEFEVVSGIDLNKREMERIVREFTGKLAEVDVALFFYGGHALQVGKQNFLLPVDARLASEADVDFEAIPLTLILRHMQLEARTNLVFLDACRDNPLAKTLARRVPTRSSYFGQGLAQVEAGGIGTLIGFSTQPDNVASDGTGRNSPYAAALLNQMEVPDMDIAVMMRHVRNQVLQATRRTQVPWEHSSLTDPFIFRPRATKPVGAPASPSESNPAPRTSPREDAEAWAAIKDTASVPVLEAFLRRFPDGVYADFALARLKELEQLQQARERDRKQRAKEASDARDREAQESRAREKEVREREAREREAARQSEAREKEAREKEAREKEAREKEAREKEAREKEAREKEAREKEAREKEARERVALAYPPQHARPGSPDHSDAVRRITAWIERDFLTDTVAYSPMVDWYDQGTISREAVLKAQTKYFARWPERQFALIPGTVRIAATGPDRYSATFELSYVVRNTVRNTQASGKSHIMINIEMIDGLPHVTRQRETKSR